MSASQCTNVLHSDLELGNAAESDQLVAFLTEHAPFLGVVKQRLGSTVASGAIYRGILFNMAYTACGNSQLGSSYC